MNFKFERKMLYFVYLGLLLILEAAMLLAPLLAFDNRETGLAMYAAFAPTCHQKFSRSLCLFREDRSYSIADCAPQTGAYVANDNSIISTTRNGALGYKFPVCARDVALYTAMLLGALAYPFARKIDDKRVPPAIYFIIAVIPLALDGVIQLFSAVGILPPYESTNTIRIITGGLAGLAVSFYIIPIMMALADRD